MGQQTFNNRGHDGLFHPSAIPRFTLPVSADCVVFPTLYPGGSQGIGSGKPFPLVDLAADFIAGDLSDGIVAVLGGVGGGVLFVPIISGFFPFHLDFVRGTGLLVPLSGALAAGPGLLKSNLASSVSYTHLTLPTNREV